MHVVFSFNLKWRTEKLMPFPHAHTVSSIFITPPLLTVSLCISALVFPFSPSVFVWKEERGATSLIGEGRRRPRCESWGFISGRNVQLIIKVRLTDQQLHRETKENTLYCLISLCLSASSSPFFFPLWTLIFSKTASYSVH